MKKYKLKKDFLYLPAETVVDIFIKEIEWTITVKKYVISIKDHLIAEIAESLSFHFDELFEEIIEPKSIFNLKEWDKYYYLYSDWYIDYITFEDDDYDKKYIKNWHAFLTKKEAVKELERRKAIQKIKKYCWENDIKTDYDEEYNSRLFYIETDWEFAGQINFDSFPLLYSPIWYFSRENADKILEKFKEELKIIFEVG